MRILLLLVLLMSGCCGVSKQEQDENADKEKVNKLPPGVVVLEKKSGMWWIVQVDGVKYLGQWKWSHGNSYQWELTPYNKDQK